MKHFVCLFFLLIASISAFTQEAIPGQTIYSSDFDIDGMPRTCTFYIPRDYGKYATYSLVIILHDKGSGAKNIIKSYGDIMHANADSVTAIVIYPDAVAGKWNDGTGNDSINDVGYLSILADYFIQRYQCDPSHVFIAGFGNGANMAYKFSCDLPGKIAAVALFSNTENKVGCANIAVPVMPAAIIPSSGKVNNTTINNMWKFFMQQRKE